MGTETSQQVINIQSSTLKPVMLLILKLKLVLASRVVTSRLQGIRYIASHMI